jgi:hypothetical protein
MAVREGPAAKVSPGHPALASHSFSLEDVRQVVREELAGRELIRDPVSAAAHASDEKEKRESVPATLEQTAAAVEASAVLDSAIARRIWTDGDAERFSEQFERMPADQRMDLLRRFSVAVNQGRLVPQTDRMPF